MLKQLAGLRFFYYCLLQVATMASFVAGGWWMWTSVVLLFGATVCFDEGIGDYEHDSPPSHLYNIPLYLAAFLAFLMTAQFIVIVGLSMGDPFGWSAYLTALGGNVFEAQPIWALAGGVIALGMHFGAAAGNVGHEFCHRINNPFSVGLSQWLCALPLHTSLPIEHVHGHHRNVGTTEDPTTARRGEAFWAYAVRSIVGTYCNAWSLERTRLKRNGRRALTLSNWVVSGALKQAIVLLITLALAGAAGAAFYLCSAIIGILILEQFNYISHYGLTRVAGTPIKPHHSWSSTRLGSSSFMFNITRHSAHHAAAGTPYWGLSYEVRGPVYPYGPFVMVILALFPSVFRAVVAPALDHWDRDLATEQECRLAQSAVDKGVSFPVAA